MKKPIFHYSNTLFTISWILTLPILIDICTACTLFSFWIVWLFYFVVLILSLIRLFHGFKQKCYKFCWGLIAQLVIGAAILLFFQLSFNDVIDTPVSNPVTPADLIINDPVDMIDSTKHDGAYCPTDKDTVVVPDRNGDPHTHGVER